MDLALWKQQATHVVRSLSRLFKLEDHIP